MPIRVHIEATSVARHMLESESYNVLPLYWLHLLIRIWSDMRMLLLQSVAILILLQVWRDSWFRSGDIARCQAMILVAVVLSIQCLPFGLVLVQSSWRLLEIVMWEAKLRLLLHWLPWFLPIVHLDIILMLSGSSHCIAGGLVVPGYCCSLRLLELLLKVPRRSLIPCFIVTWFYHTLSISLNLFLLLRYYWEVASVTLRLIALQPNRIVFSRISCTFRSIAFIFVEPFSASIVSFPLRYTFDLKVIVMVMIRLDYGSIVTVEPCRIRLLSCCLLRYTSILVKTS